ncbi:MAG: acyl carrier protein [Candidatus Acidiferrales bacterium]
MDNTQERLAKCFETVFPGMPAAEISQCSQETISAWDSIAAVTLLNVVEEEFGFSIDFDKLAELNSFDRMLAYVKSQGRG